MELAIRANQNVPHHFGVDTLMVLTKASVNKIGFISEADKNQAKQTSFGVSDVGMARMQICNGDQIRKPNDQPPPETGPI